MLDLHIIVTCWLHSVLVLVLYVLWFEVCRSPKYVFLVNQPGSLTTTTTTISHLLYTTIAVCKFGNLYDQQEFTKKNPKLFLVPNHQKNLYANNLLLQMIWKSINIRYLLNHQKLWDPTACKVLPQQCNRRHNTFKAAKTVHHCILRCIDS